MSQFGFRTSPNIQSALSSRRSLSPPPSTTPTSLRPPSTSSTTSLTMAVTSSAPRTASLSAAAAAAAAAQSLAAVSHSPPSTISTSTSGPPGPPPLPLLPPGSARCCDTGRPIFTDPITGQTVCSCQYELLGGYQRLAAAGAAGMAGLPALSMYSTPYGPEGMAAYFPALGADQAPFYSPTGGALELKENLAAGATWPYPSVYHPYDAAFAGYPFNGYGMDLNGARRKNATRETTSTLKAWLSEHKKNPYPTKGEKIMLAIITKMTLTQVSTWFANARRRLKKENKMTWEPRNRVEDEDNNNEDDDQKSTDGKDLLDSKDSGTASSEDGDRPAHHPHHPRLHGPAGDTGSEWSESRPDSGPDSPECLYDRSTHPAFLPPPRTASISPPPSHLHHHSSVVSSKPRIWSLADMASKDSPDNTQSSSSSSFQYQLSAAAAAAAAVSGRLGVPPVRLPPPPPHHSSPYARTHEFYRSLYGPAAAQQLAAAAASSGNTELLESYQRTLGAAAAASGLVSASGSAVVKSPLLGVPLGLTTASNASRMSPSSTSSISSGSETPLKPIALNKA